MAEQMQDIKRRIKSVTSTERITNAMKLVSASKLRRAKNVYEHSKGFLDDIFESMADALNYAENVPAEYVDSQKEVNTKCYVLITSSNGLCGGFNTNIIKALEDILTRETAAVKLATIGTKGREYFERRGYDVVVSHDDPADSITFDEAKKVVGPLIEMFDSGEIDEIELCFTSYINTLKQEVVVKKLLPFHLEDFHKASSLDHLTHEMEYEPSGIRPRLHCLTASSATFCQRSSFLPNLPFSTTTVLSMNTGVIAWTPSSTHFWMIVSILPAFGTP